MRWDTLGHPRFHPQQGRLVLALAERVSAVRSSSVGKEGLGWRLLGSQADHWELWVKAGILSWDSRVRA